MWIAYENIHTSSCSGCQCTPRMVKMMIGSWNGWVVDNIAWCVLHVLMCIHIVDMFMWMFVYIYIHVHLCIYRSVYLCVYVFIYIYVYIYICIYASIHLSIYLSSFPFVYHIYIYTSGVSQVGWSKKCPEHSHFGISTRFGLRPLTISTCSWSDVFIFVQL